MKTILLPFYDDDAAEAALDVTRQLAARFGSYVEGLFVMRPRRLSTERESSSPTRI